MKNTSFLFICLYVVTVVSGCAMYRTRTFEQVGPEIFVGGFRAEFDAHAYSSSRSANPREDHDFSISLEFFSDGHLSEEISATLKDVKVTSDKGDLVWELLKAKEMKWIEGDHRFLWYSDKSVTISRAVKKLMVEFEVEMKRGDTVEPKSGVINLKRHESGFPFFLLD